MKLTDFLTEIFPKTLNYRLARMGLLKPVRPVTLTYSVTGACNSLCKTCAIGEMCRKDPQRLKQDLTLDEIEKIFKSIGHVYFFNVSGGEPFLRKDLFEIVALACKYLTPRIVHVPTNAILSQRIYDDSKRILDFLKQDFPQVQFSVKPSIDGVGDRHDEIRGVPGNFKKLEKTISLLKELEKDYPNFHLELGTVISQFNIHHLDEIENYVHSAGIQSYRNEIAEQREEFYNIGDPITPSGEDYERLMKRFKEKVKENIKGKKRLAQVTEALRLTYYDIAVRIMKEKRQVIPCYAGISNVHLNYDGQLWPCCVLGYAKPLGNLRETGYDFDRIWFSERAKAVRTSIRNKECACPLANQAYSNILCHAPSIIKSLKHLLTLKR